MFQKYVKIQNHYQSKFIYKFKQEFPDLENYKYIIQEKIDGGNISIIFTSNEEKYEIAKRSKILDADDNIFAIKGWIKNYDKELKVFQNIANELGKQVTIFGEAYGSGVQKRIDYGEDKYFKMFDMVVDGQYQTQDAILLILSKEGITDLLVPTIAVVDSLTEALEISTEFNSKLIDKEDNLCEGVVIKPYEKVIINNGGSIFYIKKKNEKFFEKGTKKINRKPMDSDLLALQTTFRSYINENRVLSVFSKEGEIDDTKQIGTYIKLVLADAKEDFLADDDNQEKLDALDTKEMKIVFNVGSMVVDILKKYL